jgi:hypothetical protein
MVSGTASLGAFVFLGMHDLLHFSGERYPGGKVMQYYTIFHSGVNGIIGSQFPFSYRSIEQVIGVIIALGIIPERIYREYG